MIWVYVLNQPLLDMVKLLSVRRGLLLARSTMFTACEAREQGQMLRATPIVTKRGSVPCIVSSLICITSHS